MHAVGHVSDRHTFGRPVRKQRFKQMPAYPAVQSAHAVDGSTAVYRQMRHVEKFGSIVGVLLSQRQQLPYRNTQLLFGIAGQILLDQRGGETVKAGGDRGVRGKQIARTGHRQCGFEVQSAFLHKVPCAFQHGKRRMAFIQVAHLRFDAERHQQLPAADAQQYFLLQAQLRPAAVELAGDTAVCGIIRRVIAVQQIELHPTDLHLPRAQPYRIAGHVNLQAHPFAVGMAQRRDRQLSGIVIRIQRLLRAFLVYHLAKVALLVEQAHADDRHAEITGGFELITGNITQPARVNGQRFAQHILHAEIGNTAQLRLCMGLLKPGGCFYYIAPAVNQVVDNFAELGIGKHLFQLFARDGLHHDPRIMRELPQHRVKFPPHLVGGVIPRGAHIQRKLGEGVETLYV